MGGAAGRGARGEAGCFGGRETPPHKTPKNLPRFPPTGEALPDQMEDYARNQSMDPVFRFQFWSRFEILSLLCFDSKFDSNFGFDLVLHRDHTTPLFCDLAFQFYLGSNVNSFGD